MELDTKLNVRGWLTNGRWEAPVRRLSVLTVAATSVERTLNWNALETDRGSSPVFLYLGI